MYCINNGLMDALSLHSWNLPASVIKNYQQIGLNKLFSWQVECLKLPGILDGRNLVYSAPTSAGKSVVAEILLLKKFLETKKKTIYILPYISLAKVEFNFQKFTSIFVDYQDIAIHSSQFVGVKGSINVHDDDFAIACREKVYAVRYAFEVCGLRVDGFMGGISPPGGLDAVDVAVCTIEKANSLINKLIDENKIDKLGMVIVDEIHMVSDSNRGYLIELLLTKIMFMNTVYSRAALNSCRVSIVGMSATVPNLDLMASWLDAAFYQTDFRPVPLTSYMKIGSEIFDKNLNKIRSCSIIANMTGDEDDITNLCLETLQTNHSVLIFCPTKNWCEKLAKSIAYQFSCLNKSGFGVLRSFLKPTAVREVIEQLRRSPAGLDSILKVVVPFAVAYHHAGLTIEERDIVETGFRNNVIRVLVATSTLSSGVNLPARRVIIRTPSFNKGLLDVRSYHQMSGRAGRKGMDDVGESILVCKLPEKMKGKKLMTSSLPPVKSCLVTNVDSDAEITSAIRRAILEVIVNGIATTNEKVKAYINCTLLTAQMRESEKNSYTRRRSTTIGTCDHVIKVCLDWLQDHEFIRIEHIESKEASLTPTKLGKAAMMSSLPTSEALRVLADLQTASKAFALDCELHLVYQITPIYTLSNNINWYNYLSLFENLSPPHCRVAQLVGVDEGYITRLAASGGMRGSHRLSEAKERQLNIHTRFYAALMLHDLVQEVPLHVVCRKYDENRGMVQSLQQSAATFAGMVTAFCQQLGWWSLEILLREFQSRLIFGVHRELLDLMQISLLNSVRARVLFSAGLETCESVARSETEKIESILRNANRFVSKRDVDNELSGDELSSIRFIRVPGHSKSVTEKEAAEMIVREARLLCGLNDSSILSKETCSETSKEVEESLRKVVQKSILSGPTSGAVLKIKKIPDKQLENNATSTGGKIKDAISSKEATNNKVSKNCISDRERANYFANDSANLNTENDVLSEAKAFQNGCDKENLDLLNSSVSNLRLNDNLYDAAPKFENSVTESQMAAILEEDFVLKTQNASGNLVSKLTPQPASSTPLSESCRLNSCSFSFHCSPPDQAHPLKSNHRSKRCSLDELFSSANDFSNELFATTSSGREKLNSVEPGKPKVDWSTESAFLGDAAENSSNVLPFENCTDTNSSHQVECRLSLTTSPSLNNARPDPSVNKARPDSSEELCSEMIQDIFEIINVTKPTFGWFLKTWKSKSHFSIAVSTKQNERSACESEVVRERLSEIAVYWSDSPIYFLNLDEEKNLELSQIANILSNFSPSTVVTVFRVKRTVKLLLKHLRLCSFNLVWQDPYIALWTLNPDTEYRYDPMDLLEKHCLNEFNLLEGFIRSDMKYEANGNDRFQTCVDAFASFQVMKRLREELKNQFLWNVFTKVEMPHQISMAILESNGIAIDIKRVKVLSSELYTRKQSLQSEAWKIVGRKFNLMSVSELRKVFCELGLASSSFGKYWSTNKENLMRLRQETNSHPLVSTIIDWRSVHYAFTCVQQHLTNDSGESKDDYSFSLREFFIATEDFVLLAADYSQLELRLMAHFSEDASLLKVFSDEKDLFRELAATFYGKVGSPNAVTDKERQFAKEIVYAMNYGIGTTSLAAKLKVSEVDIEDFRCQFFESYPRLHIFFKRVLEDCRQKGYVSTLLGRRRYFPHISSKHYELRMKAERQARNTVIAGSAADLVKSATLKINEEMIKRNWNIARESTRYAELHQKDKAEEENSNRRARSEINFLSRNSCFLIHQLHDELIYEVKSHLVNHAAVIVRECMTNTFHLKVPFTVKIKTGPSWKNLDNYLT